MKHIVNVPRERGASAEVCQWTVSQKQHATIASDASEHSQAVWRPPAGCHSTLSGAASLTGHAGPDTSKETQQLPEHQQQQGVQFWGRGDWNNVPNNEACFAFSEASQKQVAQQLC